ncbi:hypothetical protein R6Q59_035026 [Mikania micrantha]
MENEEKISEKAIENDDNEIVIGVENLEKKQDDVEETKMGEHGTMVAYYREKQSLGSTTKDIISKEEGDKSADAKEETDLYDEAIDEREQTPEELTNEIKISVETKKEKDFCISTQIEFQGHATKNEEYTIESDADQKEKLDDPFVKEGCEENEIKFKEERQLRDSSNVKTRESIHENTEVTKSSDKAKENMEQQELVHVTTNVCSSTHTDHTQKPTKDEGNSEEETIENDDVQTKKPESPLVEAVCEATSSEMAESEGVKHTNGFCTTLNENETLSKEEKQENKDEIKALEVQGEGDDVASSQSGSNKDIKETTISQHDTIVAYVEDGKGVSAMPKELFIEETQEESIVFEEMSLEHEQPNEQKVETYSLSKTKRQNSEDENKKEGKSIPHESVELEQTKEQNVVEVQACLNEIVSEKTEDKITKKDEGLSHDSVDQINKNNTKEEKCFPDEITKEIETPKPEHEPLEEKDEELKEKITDSNETTTLEAQQDVTPSTSLGISTEDTSNLDEAKVENERLLIEDLESVSEMHIPEVMPRSEDSKMREECLISATTYANEENMIVTKGISSDENLEIHGSTQQPENSYSITKENVAQLEQIGEINTLYTNRDGNENVTQDSQLNSTEDGRETVKDVILTEEIEQVSLGIEKENKIKYIKEQIDEEDSYSPELQEKSAQNQKEIVHVISNTDSILVEKPQVTEVKVDGQIGQEDFMCKE